MAPLKKKTNLKRRSPQYVLSVSPVVLRKPPSATTRWPVASSPQRRPAEEAAEQGRGAEGAPRLRAAGEGVSRAFPSLIALPSCGTAGTPLVDAGKVQMQTPFFFSFCFVFSNLANFSFFAFLFFVFVFFLYIFLQATFCHLFGNDSIYTIRFIKDSAFLGQNFHGTKLLSFFFHFLNLRPTN